VKPTRAAESAESVATVGIAISKTYRIQSIEELNMDAPKGFESVPIWDEKRIHYSHRRKVRNGWDYWTQNNPLQFKREVWIGNAGRYITWHTMKGKK
jgi:hypothetical protein